MTGSDLVTRLRALADDMGSDMTPPGVDPLVIYVRVSQGAKALREAADALEQLTAANVMGDACHRDYPKLEAKLAEADERRIKLLQINDRSLKERDEARAEAATLCQALTHISMSNAPRSWILARVNEALSHPGPGAALLERVKKLEAVAEAGGRFYREVRPNTYDPQRAHYDLGLALAALDKKEGPRS